MRARGVVFAFPGSELTCLTSWMSVRRLPAHCIVLVTLCCGKGGYGVGSRAQYRGDGGWSYHWGKKSQRVIHTYTQSPIHPSLPPSLHVKARTCGKLRLRSSRESLKDLPPSTDTVCAWMRIDFVWVCMCVCQIFLSTATVCTGVCILCLGVCVKSLSPPPLCIGVRMHVCASVISRSTPPPCSTHIHIHIHTSTPPKHPPSSK